MFWHDVRLAARLLLKDKWYTAVAVLALGIGIGVNSTIFTFVNAVLLRGLPYAHSDRIMFLQLTNPGAKLRNVWLSYPDYETWRDATRSFEDLAAFRSGTMNVSDAEGPAERALGTWITANGFELIGQPTLFGRTFLAGEDAPGAEPVAIIGYGLWQSRFGGDPAILTRTIRVNETPARIVGVMPQGMKFPATAEMWMPLVPDAAARKRSVQTLGVFGRLKAGITREQAQAEMTAVARTIAAEHPDTNKGFEAVVMPYNDRYNGGEIKRIFLVLMGAVVLVLVIACANVANLLLARSSSRAKEMALRISLGATRWRVVRQLLVESVLLGCLAGVFGLVLSIAGVRVFDMAMRSVNKPYWIQFTIDGTVFAFLAAVCLLTGVLFGLAPALQVSRANVNELLKEGGRSGGTSARSRKFSSAMVVAEVALTVLLLVAAGLMVRSYLKLQALEIGFDPRDVIAGTIGLAEPRWDTPESRIRFGEQLLERVRAVPGVEAATVASSFPFSGGQQARIEIEGRPVVDRVRAPRAFAVAIADEYFATLQVSLRQGRAFSAADGRAGAEVAIVNERFAAQMFDGENPIGRRFRLLSDDRTTPWLTVVGVAPSIRQNDPQQVEPEPVLYQPFRQDPPRSVGLMVRTAGRPAGIARALRDAVRQVNADQPLYNLKTYDEVLDDVSWLWRVFGTLFAVFAAIALLLSAIGLYAVTAYSVAQRTQEIGVRIALGARRGQVSWMILRRGLAQLGLGLAIGLVAAWFASGVLNQLLVQLSARDPLTFFVITALLVVITAAACLIPARRAMRVDPSIALRAE
jgi:putative ABC transport system permease protein